MHKGKKDKNPTGQKKQSAKSKKGTRHTTVGNVYEGGAADIHPVSGKDQRLPVNTNGPLSDPDSNIYSGVPIHGAPVPNYPERDDRGNEAEDASPQQ